MNAKKAIKLVAKKEGVSISHVRKENQKAIDEGMSNPDPSVQNYWKHIPCKGEKPTPEEVINYTSKKITGQNKPSFDTGLLN